MLYRDEFIVNKCYENPIYLKRFYKFPIFKRLNFKIWTGFGIYTSNDGTPFSSCPDRNDLNLSEYKNVIISIDNGVVYKLPSQIQSNLSEFDNRVHCETSWLYLTIEETEDLYVALCDLSDTFTKSGRHRYCLECGIKLIQDEKFCWACERGI